MGPVTVAYTTFILNNAMGQWSRGGAMMLGTGGGPNVGGSTLNNCKFEGNVAFATDRWRNNSAGGGIYVDAGANLTASGGTLFRAGGASYGAGIFFADAGTEDSLGLLRFLDNEAIVGGGALFVTFREAPFPPIPAHLWCTDCMFGRNNATGYGSTIASNARALVFGNEQPIERHTLPVWPGTSFGISLLLQDHYNQTVVRQDVDVNVTYSARNNATQFASGAPRDAVGVDSRTGLYTFPSVSVTGTPGHSFPITFRQTRPLPRFRYR